MEPEISGGEPAAGEACAGGSGQLSGNVRCIGGNRCRRICEGEDAPDRVCGDGHGSWREDGHRYGLSLYADYKGKHRRGGIFIFYRGP